MKRFGVVLAIGLTACDDPFAAESVRFYDAVTTGGEHSCAVATDGSAWCWGKGTDGELGIGVKENRETPARVRGDVEFEQISAGANHTCALATDGTAYCWGWNAFYERGNIGDPRDAEPVAVSTNVKFVSISAGEHHNCALSVDSVAYCWGANQYGQLGDGTRRTRAEPQAITGNLRFSQITAGAWHSCGVTAVGEAYCWGRNDIAQLGSGATSSFSLLPVRVSSAVPFRQIDAGTVHTCAVAVDTRFLCWGGAEFGELGTGGATPPPNPGALEPVPVSAEFPAGAAIYAGEHHTCAVGFAGNARCWGRGTSGQLGNGANLTHFHPQPVFLQPGSQHTTDLFTISELAVGGKTHTCALADQRVYCWGTGLSGELGVRDSRFAPMPQRVEN